MTDSEAYREYVNAAVVLAAGVDVRDRIDTDPNHPGDRGARADAAREQLHRDDLERFRAAQAAFLDAVSTK